MVEIARFGIACVRRVYGDWTQPNLAGWKKLLHAHSLLPVQQFQYTTGKNSTDSALIIDAMDLMHTKRFDGFCLVSSDSDFTRLAARLREEGLVVYGFGRRHTPEAFVKACTRFIYTELLLPDAAQQTVPLPDTEAPLNRVSPEHGAKASTSPIALDLPEGSASQQDELPDPVQLIRQAVEATSDENGWAVLPSVAQNILKNYPQFDTRLYKHTKFAGLVRAFPALFELATMARPSGNMDLHIRVKNGG
ncbi:hypothetical protein DA2_2750 [Desulfovibrio sp. A2]|nr:hypothetical protein DA2_2750 [Desulfovibrio sp. A2]